MTPWGVLSSNPAACSIPGPPKSGSRSNWFKQLGISSPQRFLQQLSGPSPESGAKLLAFNVGLTFDELCDLGRIPSLSLCTFTLEEKDSRTYFLNETGGVTSPLRSLCCVEL